MIKIKNQHCFYVCIEQGEWYGWVFRQNEDQQFVSVRKATELEIEDAEQIAKLADNDRLRTDNEALKVEMELMITGHEAEVNHLKRQLAEAVEPYQTAMQLTAAQHKAEIENLKRQLEEITADRDSLIWVRKMAQPDDAANYDAIMKSLVDENGRQEAVKLLKKITTRCEAEELAAKIATAKTR